MPCYVHEYHNQLGKCEQGVTLAEYVGQMSGFIVSMHPHKVSKIPNLLGAQEARYYVALLSHHTWFYEHVYIPLALSRRVCLSHILQLCPFYPSVT